MVAYSFKAQFVEAILSGRKQQTIRAPRKRHAQPGETLQLYTAMRTKHCRLIGRAVCEVVDPVELDFEHQAVLIGGDRRMRSTLSELDAFARADGFATWGEMRVFWALVPRFVGALIRWRDFEFATVDDRRAEKARRQEQTHA